MTPRELAACFAGAARQQDQRRRNICDLAALVRLAVWGKGDLPDFEELYGEKGEKRDPTDNELYAVARALNAAFGGTEE